MKAFSSPSVELQNRLASMLKALLLSAHLRKSQRYQKARLLGTFYDIHLSMSV